MNGVQVAGSLIREAAPGREGVGREGVGREGVRRDRFLATLDARTWRPRAHSAAALADLEALRGRGAYVGWLRRAAVAWSRLPQPPAGPWPLAAVGPRCLALIPEIEADLRDLDGLAVPAGTPLPRPRSGAADHAFLAGAAYVAVVTAADAAVLAAAAESLVRSERTGQPGTRFLGACREIAPAHPALRSELADWAAVCGPEACDRAILTARSLSLCVAEALRGDLQRR